jgi:hypothetical protein
MAKPDGPMRELPASFVRGAIASGIVAAVKDKREGEELMKAALLGGAALSTAIAVETLIFNKEWNVAKKGKAWKKKLRRMEMAALEAMMRQNQASGLGALTPGQQLMAGVLIGAAAAWVLGDEKMRGKLLRAGMQLYTGLAAGFEEIKEQMADIQAEMAAERMSGGREPPQ